MKEKKYQIAVFCDKCGKEITRSKQMSRKELNKEWQSAVLSAALYLPSCECSPKEKPPFLKRTFKIVIQNYVDGVLNKEEYVNPKAVLRK